MNLIAGLEQHAQAFPWSDFIVDDENLGRIGSSGDMHCGRV
jgi:hypothetical protein